MDDLTTITDALDEAQYYRFDVEAGVVDMCGDCGYLQRSTGDENALCEDHVSDKAKADAYAELSARVAGTYDLAEIRNGTGFPKGMLFVGILPPSSEVTEAPTL